MEVRNVRPIRGEAGSSLVLRDTRTTVRGFTTLSKTDDEIVDSALGFIEDGLSFVYYGVLENGEAGHSDRASAIRDAIGYLKEGIDILETSVAE